MGMNIMRMKGRAKMMRTIKVTGKGKIAVKPDMIRLYVNKEELCHEYEDTLRRSTEDTELLKDLLKTLDFREKTLKQYILMLIQNMKAIRTGIRVGSEDLRDISIFII